MKWVAAAIIVVLPIYTFLTLKYRKPGPAFQPYQDMHDRAVVLRLLSGGYQRITVDARRPAESVARIGGARVHAAPGGIPHALETSLIDPPSLPDEIVEISAPATAAADRDYPIELTCLLPDNHRQLSGAHLYLKGSAVAIIPDFERLPGQLTARTRESAVRITVPAGVLKAGSYRVTLIGERASQAWTLEVR